jgi:hypothetical protein
MTSANADLPATAGPGIGNDGGEPQAPAITVLRTQPSTEPSKEPFAVTSQQVVAPGLAPRARGITTPAVRR